MGGAGGRGPDVPVPDRRTPPDLDDIERRVEKGDVDRTDVRALVAEVRRLRAQLAATENELDEVRAGAVWFLTPEEG